MPNDLLKPMDHVLEVEPPSMDEENDAGVGPMFKFMNDLLQSWWNKWFKSVYTYLLLFSKWKQERQNCHVVDVVLIKYEHKYSKPHC